MDIYQNSRGVCIPHFVKVYITLENGHMKNRFSCIQKKHTKLLLNELEGFIGKKNSRWERTKDENASYKRTISKLVGRRGTK